MVPWCPVASYSLWSLFVSLPLNPLCSLNKAFPLRLINEICKTLPRGHWSTIPLAYSSWRGTRSGHDGWVGIYKLHCICGCLCLCLSLSFKAGTRSCLQLTEKYNRDFSLEGPFQARDNIVLSLFLRMRRLLFLRNSLISLAPVLPWLGGLVTLVWISGTVHSQWIKVRHLVPSLLCRSIWAQNRIRCFTKLYPSLKLILMFYEHKEILLWGCY